VWVSSIPLKSALVVAAFLFRFQTTSNPNMKLGLSKFFRAIRSRKADDKSSGTIVSKASSESHPSESVKILESKMKGNKNPSPTTHDKDRKLFGFKTPNDKALQSKTKSSKNTDASIQNLPSDNLRLFLCFMYGCICLWIAIKTIRFIFSVGPSTGKASVPWLCLKFQLLLGFACLIYGSTQTDLSQDTVMRLTAKHEGSVASMVGRELLTILLLFGCAWLFFWLLNSAVRVGPIMFEEGSMICLLYTTFQISFLGFGLSWIATHGLIQNLVAKLLINKLSSEALQYITKEKVDA
jgi:hypothetical protein